MTKAHINSNNSNNDDDDDNNNNNNNCFLFLLFLLLVVIGPTGIRPLKLDMTAESFKTITLIAFLDLGVPQD